jgi:hypothetical protein
MTVNIAVINRFIPKSFLTTRFTIIPNNIIEEKINSGLIYVMISEMNKAANNLAFLFFILRIRINPIKISVRQKWDTFGQVGRLIIEIKRAKEK